MTRSHGPQVACTGQEPDFAMISGHRASATIADAMVSPDRQAGQGGAHEATIASRPHRGGLRPHPPKMRPRASLNAPAGESLVCPKSDPQAENREKFPPTTKGRGSA